MSKKLDISLCNNYLCAFMKTIHLIVVCLIFFVSCKNQENSTFRTNIIDIEDGLQNLTTIKTSDFGKTIRYIPLETTDGSLVGNNPIFKVLRDYIVVEFRSPGSCLLFDKKDGHFIAKIGNIGQGPNEYSDIFSWTDEKEEFLYFKRAPGQLLKFDMQGNFCGNMAFSTPPGLADYYLLTDSGGIGYFNAIGQRQLFSLGFFAKEGNLIDSIPLLYPKNQIDASQIESISVLREYTIYGNWGKVGLIMIDYKNDTREILAANIARLWKNNGNIRFKEDYVDTLYTVSGSKLVPSIIFNTGKYHWPVEEITSKKNTNERIIITDVSENDNFVFFQCIKGLYSDEPILYNGLYNKKTGETKIGNFSNAIEDDLTHFMPFAPFGMGTSGEFISFVEAYKIMEWLEKHPEAKDNEDLAFLKQLDEEGNPVVILIE